MDRQNMSSANYGSDEKMVNILDIFMYLLSHWKWFLISLFIFGNYFGYQYSKTPFTYVRSITVMIKTPANSQSTMRLNRYNSFTAPVNVSSEMLQFQSKELMRITVDNLNADVSYVFRNKLRPQELYTRSPVKVSFPEAKTEESYALSVIPLNDQEVELFDFAGMKDKKRIIVNLNDTIETSMGTLVVSPSIYYHPTWYGRTIKVTKYPRESVVLSFLSRLGMKQLEEDAAVLRLSLQDNSTSRAADILNTMINVYNEEAIIEKNRIAVTTSDFINGRLAQIQDELGAVETDIENLRKENEGLDINMAAGLYVSDSRESYQTVKQYETDLRLARFMRQYLQDENSNELIPANTGLVDVNIENQIVQYNNAIQRRNRLVESGSTEQNPVVQDMNRSVRALRQNINRAVDNSISSLNILKQDAERQELLALSKIYALPEKQREMLSIERLQKTKEDLYLFLLNKREENALNQAMVDDNARVIDPASGSNSPVAPSFYRKMMMGGGLGIGVPMAILLLILMIDTRVHSRKDVENALSIPFLGEIPMDTSSGNQQFFIEGQGFGMMTEAFRMVRTNLKYMIRSKEAKVISTISFFPGAGKTFVATNLGVSLAQIYSRGILIDLDLRKGTMTANFEKTKAPGIANYLSDESVTFNDIVNINGVCENLDLIGIGAIAPNPTELLLSDRLDNLIDELKKKYDFIVVDSAPISLVADASVVNRITDLNIFVIRAGKFDRRLLPDLENQYLQKKWTNLGVVLNAVKKEHRGYGYNYGYGYGYSYSYGKK